MRSEEEINRLIYELAKYHHYVQEIGFLFGAYTSINIYFTKAENEN